MWIISVLIYRRAMWLWRVLLYIILHMAARNNLHVIWNNTFSVSGGFTLFEACLYPLMANIVDHDDRVFLIGDLGVLKYVPNIKACVSVEVYLCTTTDSSMLKLISGMIIRKLTLLPVLFSHGSVMLIYWFQRSFFSYICILLFSFTERYCCKYRSFPPLDRKPDIYIRDIMHSKMLFETAM